MPTNVQMEWLLVGTNQKVDVNEERIIPSNRNIDKTLQCRQDEVTKNPKSSREGETTHAVISQK